MRNVTYKELFDESLEEQITAGGEQITAGGDFGRVVTAVLAYSVKEKFYAQCDLQRTF
jgi:hypothetical protein